MGEETIFVAALEKSTPAERAAYLDGACGVDSELRRRVEALLRAHEQSGDLLDPPDHLPSLAEDCAGFELRNARINVPWCGDGRGFCQRRIRVVSSENSLQRILLHHQLFTPKKPVSCTA